MVGRKIKLKLVGIPRENWKPPCPALCLTRVIANLSARGYLRNKGWQGSQQGRTGSPDQSEHGPAGAQSEIDFYWRRQGKGAGDCRQGEVGVGVMSGRVVGGDFLTYDEELVWGVDVDMVAVGKGKKWLLVCTGFSCTVQMLFCVQGIGTGKPWQCEWTLEVMSCWCMMGLWGCQCV